MREIDELEGRNTKRFFGAIVGFAVIAVGIGLLFKSKGIGEPEQDHRILIIEDQTQGFEHYSADLGFDAISGDLEGWQRELVEEDDSRELTELGLPDILEYADRYGFGYVVIENPQRFADEIGELELEDGAEIALGEARFAALSVGDFGDPHQLSVEPPASIELGPGPTMLRALFAQPRLSQALDPNAALSDIQAARLELDSAIKMIDQLARHEQRAAELLQELDATLGSFASPGLDDAEHAARMLHEPLAGATAYPLRDGRVVLRSDRVDFLVDTNELEMRSSAKFTMRVLPADASASSDASVACPELLEGGGARGSIKRIEPSADRDALFVVREGDGTLFEFDPAAGPCGLREVGLLELPQPDNGYVAVTRRAIAMRRTDEFGMLHIDVRAAAADQPPISIIVDAPEFGSASSLVWLDDRHLASLVDLAEDQQPALVILDLDRPDASLVLPLQPPQADGDAFGHELARVPGSDPALLLRWSVGNRYTLARLDFDRPWTELIGDGEQLPLGPEIIRWTSVVSVDSHMRGFDIDPLARAVAFTYEGDLGVDVGLAPLPLAGARAGGVRVILDDGYEHRDVGFRPQHDELLFRTRVRIEQPDASLLVLHAMPIQVSSR